MGDRCAHERVVVDTDLAPERVVIDHLANLGVELWRVTDTTRLWASYHDQFAACLLPNGIDGAMTWVHRGRQNLAAGGSVMLLQRGEIHRTTALRGNGAFFLMRMGEPLLEKAQQALDLARTPDWAAEQIEGAALPDVADSLSVLATAVQAGADPYELEAWSIAAAVKLFERCSEPRIRKSPIPHAGARRAYALLMEWFGNLGTRLLSETREERGTRGLAAALSDPAIDLDLDTLAKKAGLSPSHFSRMIHSSTGLTFREHKLIARVTVGRILLEAGIRASVVAQILGYANHPAFSRDFKRSWGVSPSQWPLRNGRPR